MAERALHHRFFALAGTQPTRPALRGERCALTAGELAHQALQTATVLTERGVGCGRPVGISVRDTSRCVSAALGVLAAGGCCIPLAWDLTASRQECLLCNNGAFLALTDQPTPAAPPTVDPTPQDSTEPYDTAPIWNIAQLPFTLSEKASPLRPSPARRGGRAAWIYPDPARPVRPARVLTHGDIARAAEHLTGYNSRPREMRLRIPCSSPLWPYAVLPALASGIPLLVPAREPAAAQRPAAVHL
ncbi:AMP-binding protein [Streptomyces sp. NPDC088348]|uniref:AMP-binding protein n=1 Tax=Streptomyces sp. NPDC088348 TaxID=3365853 RepID=UPI00381FA8D5